MTVLIDTTTPNAHLYENVGCLKLYPNIIGGEAVGIGFEINANDNLMFALSDKGFRFYFLSAQRDNPYVIQLIGTLWSASAYVHRVGRKGDGTLYSEVPSRFVSEQLTTSVAKKPIVVCAGMLPWGVLEFQLPSEALIAA